MFEFLEQLKDAHSWHLIALATMGCVLACYVVSTQWSRTRAARASTLAQQQLIDESAEKLREQTARLDAALNNISQGVCMFDKDTRIVVYNRRFLEMYSLSPEMVKPGCTLRDLILHRKDVGLLDEDPDDYYRQILENVAKGESSTFLVKTTDGRLIRATNRPLPNGGWVTRHEDVTEHQHAEEQLREQKLQLDTALNNMNQGLLMFDKNARLVLCNQRYLQMYRLSADEVRPGCTLTELLELRKAKGTFSRDPNEYIKELREALSAGKLVVLTAELDDGRVISIVNRPMPDGRWVSTHEDITEARRAEERLREQKLQLDTALNNMTQGLNMYDGAGRLVVCNQRYLEMYRLPPDILKTARTAYDLIQARVAAGTFFTVDPEKYSRDLAEAMKQRKPNSAEMELHDGRIIAVHSQPTPDGNGWVVTHEDVTEHRRAEKDRDRSQAFAATVIENVPATILVKDVRTLRYMLVNRAGEEYLGKSRDQIVGRTAAEVFEPEAAARIAANDREILEHGRPQFYDEHPVITPSGDSRIVATSRLLIRDPNGEPLYLLSVVEDRTHRKQAEAQIAHMALHDSLTGLPNRVAFNACLATTIENMEELNESFALLSIDIDRFKEINDVFGHGVGDKLLCEMSLRLQAAIGGAFLARLGGDEFTIIAADGAQPAAAESLADRILQTMTEEIVIDGCHLRSSLSVGISIYPTDGSDAASLVANANAALYRAKSDGRGTFRFFEADMDKRLRDRRALRHDLQSAIERGELILSYQPQAKIDGEVIGFEALVRWHHPVHGVIPPGVFIPIAEESRLIVALGEWVLREACREAASWTYPLQVAINLSPAQFRHGDLPSLVHAVLLETGLPPARLELEITEGVLIDDFSRAVSILRRLKALGVRIAMDDFGTGYSSLSYLQSFPFDKIKIDQAFISNVEHNQQSATIVRAVIGLARGLKLPVLAEGVETPQQRAFLAAEDCNEIQGFLIGRPEPIDRYAHLTHAAPVARSGAARAAS